MKTRLTTRWIIPQRFILLIFMFVVPAFAHAQVRGVYPLGMSATNSGVTPPSGFTYSNVLLIYGRDQLKDPNGNRLPVSGNQSVILDMNSFVWVSTKTILGGARFSASATLPIAKNSLTSELQGMLSGASGFGDSYYQPFILGWQKNRADIRVVYGFLAPTGTFEANADDNVGSGYWTHVESTGATFYVTKNKATAISVFEMYEFHTHQKDTNIHPGQTFNLDYSLTHTFEARKKMFLQVGLVGYGQWQTTDKSGPTITPDQAAAHYRVNALGFASSISFLSAKVNLGVKYFKEFSNRATFEGYSLQISGGISF